jgi:hypothetical protein
MTLNFTFKFKDLAGKDIPGDNGNAGKILANMLSQQNKGNSIKMYDWALKLWNGKPIEVDDSDFDVLIALIENSEFLTIMAKAPLIEYMKSVKKK